MAQLCKDFDGDYVEVNKQLDKMGYNIGLRLIEDYLAKSNTMKRCANFRETAEMISKVCKARWHAATIIWSATFGRDGWAWINTEMLLGRL